MVYIVKILNQQKINSKYKLHFVFCLIFVLIFELNTDSQFANAQAIIQTQSETNITKLDTLKLPVIKLERLEQQNKSLPIVEQGFEPFLEFNSRSSNTTPLTDKFDIKFDLNDELNYQNLYELPAIDVKTANKIYELINDSLITEMNIFIDSLDYYNSINYNQHTIIDKIILDKIKQKKSKIIKNKFIYRIRNQSRFNDISGIENDKFIGDELDLFQRMMFRNDDFYAIIQSKKAVGELNVNEFMSGSISYKNDNFKIVLGDFMPTIGYGSVFWSSFAATKGSDIISPVMRLSKGIEPNTSVVNFNIFRGISIETNFDISSQTNLKIRSFYANNSRTTNINDIGEVTSIGIVPQFRTESEISKRGNLNEKNYTLNAEISQEKDIYGILFTNFDYDKILNPESDRFFDNQNTKLFSFYSLNNIDNFSFGTELVSDTKMNMSMKLATQTNWEKLIWTNNLRISSPNIKSMYGYNFGEINNITNQFSFYNAFEYKGFENFRFYQYFEFYNTPSKINSLPSYQNGLDLFIETEYILDSKNKFINRLKYENKREASTSEDFNQRVMFDRSRYEFRIEYHTVINETSKFRIRLEQNYINYSKLFESESGTLVYLELHKELMENLKFSSRYTIFNTNSFNSAIWQYEYAVPGYTTTTPLYDKGSRFLTCLEYEYNNSITLFLRYSSTLFNEKETIGSGNLQLNENNNSRLIFQLDLKY